MSEHTKLFMAHQATVHMYTLSNVKYIGLYWDSVSHAINAGMHPYIAPTATLKYAGIIKYSKLYLSTQRLNLHSIIATSQS